MHIQIKEAHGAVNGGVTNERPRHANDQADDPIAIVKFFTPDGSWTWFAFEFDGEDTPWCCPVSSLS
jgi:hypothetical protein